MKDKLRILIAEEQSAGVELLTGELQTVLPDFSTIIITKNKELADVIDSFKPDLILAEYKMPMFDGLKALEISKKINPSIPFIILNDVVNENLTVLSVKAGADDFVSKEHIKRLGPSVLKALDTTEQKKAEVNLALHKDHLELTIIERTRELEDSLKIFAGRELTIRELQKQLRETSSNLKAFIDNRNDSIWAVDNKFNYILFNSYFADAYYSVYKKRLQKDLNAIDILTSEQKVFWKSKYKTVLEGKNLEFEFSEYFEGREHYFQVNLNPVYSDSVITGISAISFDITNLKETEKALMIEKIFSEKVLDTSQAIIVGLNREHKIMFFNKGSEFITGYAKSEVIGKDWFELFFSKEMIEEMNIVWEKAWGESAHSYINSIFTKEGNEKIISWHSTFMCAHQDKSKHLVISIGEDITELRNIGRDLEKYV